MVICFILFCFAFVYWIILHHIHDWTSCCLVWDLGVFQISVFFLKPLLCCFEFVPTCAAQRWAGTPGQFLHRISVFLSLPSGILLKVSFTYLHYFCTVCTTGVVLRQNGEIIKRNKSEILSILWPEVPPFPKPLAWKMWSLVGSLVELWLLILPATLTLLRAHYHELRGRKRKKKQSRDCPPYSLDHKAPFPGLLARKKRFLWAFYLSVVPSASLCWVPTFGSQMQDKRGKNRKLTSIWIAFLDFDSLPQYSWFYFLESLNSCVFFCILSRVLCCK